MLLLIRTEVGSHTKLPRSITAEVISLLLSNIEIVDAEFEEESSIIGYLNEKEENIVEYSRSRKKSYIDSFMGKKIKSGTSDQKEIKHASTEVAFTEEELGNTNIDTYMDIVNFINDPRQQGTKNEAVVVCCVTQINNPLDYTAIHQGPLWPINPIPKTSDKNGLSESISTDLMIFGPAYTSLHADFLYSRRSSLIPSWNRGVIKLWIIRRDCSSTTNRFERTAYKRVQAKDFVPYHEIAGVLQRPEQFLLLIQRPGDLIRHNGRHFHCVITVLDPAINPTLLSMSLGRRDCFTNDKLDYCNGALLTDLLVKKKKGAKCVRRKPFKKRYLKELDKRRLKWTEKKENLKPKKKRKSSGGFKMGNQEWKRQKVSKTSSNFMYTCFYILASSSSSIPRSLRHPRLVRQLHRQQLKRVVRRGGPHRLVRQQRKKDVQQVHLFLCIYYLALEILPYQSFSLSSCL